MENILNKSLDIIQIVLIKLLGEERFYRYASSSITLVIVFLLGVSVTLLGLIAFFTAVIKGNSELFINRLIHTIPLGIDLIVLGITMLTVLVFARAKHNRD